MGNSGNLLYLNFEAELVTGFPEFAESLRQDAAVRPVLEQLK